VCEGRAGRGRRGEPKKKRRPSSRCGALSDAPSTQGGRPFLWARLGTSLAYPPSCRLAGGARGRSQRAPERARVRKKRCAVRGASWREQKKMAGLHSARCQGAGQPPSSPCRPRQYRHRASQTSSGVNPWDEGGRGPCSPLLSHRSRAGALSNTHRPASLSPYSLACTASCGTGRLFLVGPWWMGIVFL